jgi:phosphoglucosamine mutase
VGSLFGTDGIRGEANRYPMDGGTAFAVGQAVAVVAGRKAARPDVIVGKDTRVSGDMLEYAVAAGIASMGGRPKLAGVLPTPGIAHLTAASSAGAGVMISASHNPFEDNGIKVFSGRGFKLSDDEELEIETLVLEGGLRDVAPQPAEIGPIACLEGAADRYVDFLQSAAPRSVSFAGLEVVLDTANGAAFAVAPAAFRQLGASVSVIHDAPDGLNINADCGSQHTDDLARTVVATGAAAGLAFDGDADRLIAVDEKGGRLSGDQVLVICALMLREEGRLKGDLLVSTVMSNMGLRAACKRYGFKHHASQVGDRYVLEDMLRLGAALGGEESGHVIFLDHQTTGDGILTGLQLVAALLRSGKPLSELARAMDVFPQKLVNVPVKGKPPLESLPEVMKAVKQTERELGAEGRVLVRYSGTQNLCRVMVEGPTEAATSAYAERLAGVIRSVIG